GESVCFVIAIGKDGREEARQVRRAEGVQALGDIVEWNVEPGTWRGEGVIAPHDGSSRIKFFGHDMSRAGGGTRPTNPRPWYAARYRSVSADGRLRAVDIEIDWRYPLQRFAYLGEEA